MGKTRVFLIIMVACLCLLPENTWSQERYQVGVCDWMVQKRQKLGEFALARELGCDGVEMDMGSLGQRDSFDTNEEMEAVVNELFACSNVNYTPDGKAILCILPQYDIEQLLG